MGQYKVPSNVETEDKILGPLSVKQFIYVVIGLMWGFIAIRLIAPFNIVVGLIIAAPISLTMFALGFIQREGVSFENYFLAAVQFLMSPRKLVWHKDDLVKTIKAAPKQAAQAEPVKNFGQGQLQKLAFTLDTHGNYKDPSLQLADEANPINQRAQRVVDSSTVTATQAGTQPYVPQQPAQLATERDDVLDEASGHSAEVGQMLQNVEVNVRDQAVARMQQAIAAVPQSQPVTAVTQTAQVAEPLTELANRTNTPVQRLAREANSAVLREGQEVSLQPKPTAAQ